MASNQGTLKELTLVTDLKFIGWKLVELAAFVVALPFMFIGLWVNEFSKWCRERAIRLKH